MTQLACWCVWARERGPFSLSRGATFNELRLEIVEAFRDVFGIYMSQTTLALLLNTCIHHASWGEHLVNHPCTARTSRVEGTVIRCYIVLETELLNLED